MSNDIEFMAALGWGCVAVYSLRCAIFQGTVLDGITFLGAILCLVHVVGGGIH